MSPWLGAALVVGAVLAWPGRRDPTLQLRPRSDHRTEVSTPGSPEEECLEVLDSMVVLLEAGTPSLRALDMATSTLRSDTRGTSSGWRQLHAAAFADTDVAEAWEHLAQEWACSAFADVAVAWRMSSRHGCPLADALGAAAQGIRATRRHRGAVEAAVAGARATMGVLVLLPALGCALGTLLGVDMIGAYLGPSGLVTLWPGLVLLLVGRRWADGLVAKTLKVPVPAGGAA